MPQTQDDIRHLKVQRLQPNPFQPRGRIEKEDISDLVASVKKHGVLEPLLVAETPAGYQIIAGERRWRAAREAELETIPAVVKKTTPKGMLEMAIVENVQRQDLSPIEKAKAFDQLRREFGYDLMQISEQIGKSRGYISNSIRLLKLPDAVKDGLASGLIDEGHARALINIKHVPLILQVYKQILKEDASVRRAEQLSRNAKQALEKNQTEIQDDPKDAQEDEESKKQMDEILNTQIDLWREQLSQAFKKTQNVRLSRSRRQTKVVITLKGDPDETQEDLEKILKLAEME